MKKLFIIPIGKAYWSMASKECSQLKKLCVCALMIALQIIISNPFFSIQVHENLKITFGYLVTAVNCAIVGPVMALIYGFVLDNVSFMVFPSGTYFFGYTLSSMAGALVYALFFYRSKISVLRIALAKLVVNLLVNVALGSVWSSMLYSKGYIYYATASLVKNISLLPIEILLLSLLFKAIIPFLYRRRMIYIDHLSIF